MFGMWKEKVSKQHGGRVWNLGQNQKGFLRKEVTFNP